MFARSRVMLVCLAVFAVCFLGVSALNAEMIRLKSGKGFEGKIISRGVDFIKVDFSGVEMTLYFEEIDSIDGKKLSAALKNNPGQAAGSPQPFEGDTRLSKADFDEVSNFYYRSPKPDILFRVIKALLSYDDFISPRNTDFPVFAHFVAAVAVNTPVLMEGLKAEEYSARGARKDALRRILDAAEQYKPAEADSPEHIAYLWQEFIATGEEAPVKKMVSVFERPQSSEDDRAMRFMVASLFKNTLIDHPKALSVVQGLSQNTKGEYKDSLDDILAEIAQPSIQRGLNYKYQNDLPRALEEYNKALALYPGSSASYTNIAVIFELQGDMEQAFKAMYKAIELDPEDAIAAYNLGRLYFLEKQYGQAIIWYQKALDTYPKKPDYHHAIGRAYQEKGDTQKAVVHYKRYLALAPHDEFVPLVKQYLASVNVIIEEDPDDVVAMLERKQYAQLEKYLEKLLRGKEKTSDGYSYLDKAYGELIGKESAKEMSGKVLKSLSAWQAHSPDSHFANAALGAFYIQFAWEARGAGFASSVTPEVKESFRKRLLLAKEYLEKAYSADSADALVPAYLISVARGLGSEKDEMEKQFQNAVKADPLEFQAYNLKFLYLTPKWHGSVDEMFDFAREAAEKAPAGSLAPRILAKAHWEMYYRFDDNTYFKNPRVWAEIKQVYQKLLSSFPESIELHNWLALTAYYADDYQTARGALEKVKDEWLPDCWGSAKYFNKVKKEIGM